MHKVKKAGSAHGAKGEPVVLGSGMAHWFRRCWHTLVAAQLAVFFVAAVFRANGFQVLGDNALLGGVDAFGPDEEVELMVGTVIIVGFAVILLASAAIRAVSTSIKGSNVAMIAGVLPAVAMIWMVTPVILAAMVVTGAAIDLGRQDDANRQTRLRGERREVLQPRL